MNNESEIRWGVIGAGDVVSRKSGGPLQSLPDSRWLALCRRDSDAAKKMALRFGVPKIYTDAAELIADESINAVYIATPPSSHAEYTIQALHAGKHVYLEKPMAMNHSEALEIESAVRQSGCKLVMAHYRRALPAFDAVGEMLRSGRIGTPLFSRIRIIQPAPGRSESSKLIVAGERDPWRVHPEISGGGLFHDLAPHQLDLCLSWFGDIQSAHGISRRLNTDKHRLADNYVNGHIEFESGMILDGVWCFAADSSERSADEFAIYGTEGMISFSFFGERVILESGGKSETLSFDLPEWLQEPMLKRCVDYFLDRGENPCSVENGVKTMKIIDTLTGN